MPGAFFSASIAANCKGRLQPGADADIVVFDPATVTDMATFETPMQASVGYRYVIVGGKVMVQDSRVTPDLFPGVAITSSPRPQ